MLTITVPGGEQFNEITQEFVTTKAQTLELEHSLISLSKWESKWCKSFLSSKNHSNEEIIDYIRCMTITKNVDPNVYFNLTNENFAQVQKYIEAPMTATYFSNDNRGRGSREIITSELIYYWMIANQIPFACEKWHINRLLTLIRVCNIKNAPPKKMGKRELMSRNAALNAARRKQFGTSG